MSHFHLVFFDPSLDNNVLKRAETFDTDLDLIPAPQGEVIVRDDTCPRHQAGPLRERVIPEEVFDQFLGVPLEFSKSRFAGEHGVSSTKDRHRDGGGLSKGLRSQQDTGAQGTATVVVLHQWQIQRVLANKNTRTHIIADRVAEDMARWIN